MGKKTALNIASKGDSHITAKNYKRKLSKIEKLFNSGRYEAAKKLALELLPNSEAMDRATLLNLLGGIALKQNNYELALGNFQQAIIVDPKRYNLHYNMGMALQYLGNDIEAIKAYTRAALLKPGYWQADLAAARLLIKQQNTKPEQALPYIIRACKANPLNYDTWLLYAEIIDCMPQYEEERELREPLEKALTQGLNLSVQSCVVRQILCSEWCLQLKQLFYSQKFDDIDKLLANDDFITEMLDNLLLSFMRRGAFTNIFIEYVLTRLRRQFLLNEKRRHNQKWLPMLISMWALCFRNEYVFYVEDDEKEAADNLLANITARISEESAATAKLQTEYLADIAILGSYHRLWKTELVNYLVDWQPSDAEIADMLREQIAESIADSKRMHEIPVLVEPSDNISNMVREQYEQNPYPRWREIADNPEMTLEEYMQRSLIQQNWQPLCCASKTPEILIAGCGTGQHVAIISKLLPNSRILAIDISLTSLAYAKRKAEELKLRNVEFMQADILNLDKIGRRFDFIESIGVLHHMHNPMAGWKILTELLRPGGIMKIGLYSKIARHVISLAREEIKKRGLSATDDDIRQYRRELWERNLQFQAKLRSGEITYQKKDNITQEKELTPLIAELFMAADFFSLSECRDLLFHVQEHNFTLPEIKAAIADLQLDFLGLDFPKTPKEVAFQKSLPADDRSTDLDKWHEYEQRNHRCFLAMYVFWLQKPRDT